jgi:hypothetical protein
LKFFFKWLSWWEQSFSYLHFGANINIKTSLFYIPKSQVIIQNNIQVYYYAKIAMLNSLLNLNFYIVIEFQLKEPFPKRILIGWLHCFSQVVCTYTRNRPLSIVFAESKVSIDRGVIFWWTFPINWAVNKH